MCLNFSSNFLHFEIEMANGSKQGVYEFDEFRLDAANLMLYRNEQEIVLPPKVVETLLVLIENRGEIVSKDELMNKVWADVVVEGSSLSQCLYRLRKTLGERADGEPYIETLRQRGYRFNGEVRLLKTVLHQNDPASPPSMENLSAAPRRDVEQRSNVLKVVDWREAEKPAVETASLSRKSAIGKAAIVAAISVLLIASIFYLRSQFSPPANSKANAKAELTILRLTNGSAPMDATISPDGKYFVYHETDGNISHLWLQQTGGSSRVEIAPPLEKIISCKTFSPDGGFVYFVASDKLDMPTALYRVPTLGGAPVKILDNINSPVSFSPDGREIVFQRRNPKTVGSILIIAAANGGEERVLLTPSGGLESLEFPAWSPDGKLIAFCVITMQELFRGSHTLVGVNPQTGAIETLSPEKWDNCYRMAWTHDGRGLVFIGTKAGESYSTRRNQIYFLAYPQGEARRLTTDGDRYDIVSLGVTDRDEILAVPDSRSSQIWQMNPNGDAHTAVQLTNGLADGRAGLAPLADGRIGYVTRMGDNLNIWLADADGSNQKQITYDPPILEELRAAPDSRFFVFSSQRDGRSQLFVMDVDGANLRQLTFGDSSNVDSTVSPDGNWIVYHSVSFTDGYSLWKISSTGGEPVLLTNKNCITPHFSPDGKFVSCVYEGTKLAIVSAEDGSIIKTFETISVPQLNNGARWTPDGQALVYCVLQKNIANLWIQPTNGGAARQLTNFTNGMIYNFAYSPDGTRLYVARGHPIRDAVLIKNFK